MDNVEMETKKCAHCGKEFTYKKTKVVRKFCSKNCRIAEENARHVYKSRKARLERDPEYRAKRNAATNAYKKRRLAEKKEDFTLKLAHALWNAKSEDEIRQIVEKYTRIKAEFYR